MNNSLRKTYIIILLLLIPFLNLIKAQSISGNTADSALYYFENKDFENSARIYAQLLDLYPGDVQYSFYLGASLVELNTNSELSESLLKTSSSKYNDAFYYLALNYYNNYNFSKALDYYRIYSSKASSKDKKEKDIYQKISMAYNSNNLLENIKSYSYSLIDSIKLYQITDWYTSKRNGTTAQPINNNLFISGSENKHGFIYYIRQTRSKGQDIFRLKISENPEVVEENINSPVNIDLDETYPYYFIKENRLYFASKGHNSIGGYDIFYSDYDSIKDTYSEPVNAGLPINSPYDDICAILNDKDILLITNRKDKNNNFHIFKLEEAPVNKDSILTKSYLSLNNYTTKKKTASGEYEVKIMPTTTAKNISGYEKTLQKALKIQQMADSLLLIAEKKRFEKNATYNHQQKAELNYQINYLIQQSLGFEEEAKKEFIKAYSFESDYLEEKINGGYLEDPAKLSLQASTKDINDRPEKDEHEEISFSVKKDCAYNSKEEFSKDYFLPDGICYQIQLGAFSKKADYCHFKGIFPIYELFLTDRNIYKYTAGIFNKYEKANEALSMIKEIGFTDSYIVAFNSGMPISVKRAVEIEEIERNNKR